MIRSKHTRSEFGCTTTNRDSVTNRREFLTMMGRGAALLVGGSLVAPVIGGMAGTKSVIADSISAAALNAQSLSAHSPSAASRTAKSFSTDSPRAALTPMTVYKDPGCGCCKEWVKIMQKAGFAVTAHDTADMNSIKSTMGVPTNLQSCHTAIVGNYVFEGHVPADVVMKLLQEKPIARGLAVPAMPNGSPGMEGPTKDKYDVLLFERSGKTRVYASR